MCGACVCVCVCRQRLPTDRKKTYGSNSAGGRDGTDGAGALSEGVSEHINRGLYVPGVKRKTIAIDLQLCGEEI